MDHRTSAEEHSDDSIPHSETLLMCLSLDNCSIDEVVSLPQQGAPADVDGRDSEARTPLMKCALKGDSAMCQRLLDHGADVSLVDGNGTTAVMWACLEGHHEVLDVLLSHGGMDLDVVETWGGQTALMWASLNNHPNIVRTLMSRGAALGVRDRWGQTAKDRAARFGHGRIVSLIEDEEKRRSKPLPLIELCRHSLHRHMTGKTQLHRNINNLPIPPTLKRYLMFKG